MAAEHTTLICYYLDLRYSLLTAQTYQVLAMEEDVHQKKKRSLCDESRPPRHRPLDMWRQAWILTSSILVLCRDRLAETREVSCL